MLPFSQPLAHQRYDNIAGSTWEWWIYLGQEADGSWTLWADVLTISGDSENAAEEDEESMIGPVRGLQTGRDLLKAFIDMTADERINDDGQLHFWRPRERLHLFDPRLAQEYEAAAEAFERDGWAIFEPQDETS